MIIIKSGDQAVVRLLGKQKVRISNYRLMKYMIRETVDGDELLCNNVTGELILLDDEEAELLKTDIISYSDVLRDLIEHYFLVPVNFDEYQAVAGLRVVLRRLESKPEYITHYTIFPTTSCNARCYYCFEKGVKTETMTEQTARETAAFIQKNCGGNDVLIDWFGGEPTLAVSQMNQICRELSECGVVYTSRITTNGYLLDQETVQKAVNLWHLKRAMIAVDGIEENYNKIKSYISVRDDNPYQRVMKNIGLLLQADVYVSLRMNFDVQNYMDFEKLIQDVLKRYQEHKNLQVWVHSITDEHHSFEHHGDESWFNNKIQELSSIALQSGLLKRDGLLPVLKYRLCPAADDGSVTITPDGHLVRCPEQFDEKQYIGNVRDGITNASLAQTWKQVIDYDRCKACALFPTCVNLVNCNVKGRCEYRLYNFECYKEAMKDIYQKEGNKL